MKNFTPLLFCLTIAACAPMSVTGMEKLPKAYTSTTHKSAHAFANCIVPKIETYPVMVGFSFEDRTVLVQTRDTPTGVDIYQMVNNMLMTLVTVRHNSISFYIPEANLAAARLKTDFPRMINACK